MGWRDSFCGWCGQEITEDVRGEIVALDSAPPLAVALGHTIDGILVLALAPVMFSFVLEDIGPANWGSLPVCLPFLWFYWVALWSGGRQSLGQFVFRLVTLDPQRLPLSPRDVAYSLSLGLFRRPQSRTIAFWKIQESPS